MTTLEYKEHFSNQIFSTNFFPLLIHHYRHHEFFLHGWELLADLRPRLAALEDHISRAEDQVPSLIKEGKVTYFHKIMV